MHTTNCVQPPSLIAYDISGEVEKFIDATHIDKIVRMPYEIAKGSLIGSVARSISIEVSNSQLSETILAKLADDIARYQGSETLSKKRDYFKVIGKLMKANVSLELQASLRNFEPLADGSVPVLTGDNSYKKQTDYIGFRAVREELSYNGKRYE